MHEDQIDVPAAVAAALVRTQFPQWRALDIRPLHSTGTVNAIHRIGDRLAARFPLRRAEPGTVRTALAAEARASAELARAATVPVPEPVALGEPGAGYPMPWAVQTWVPGTPATDADPAASEPFAGDLARLITALRAAPTRGRRFSGSGRGGELPDHDAWVETCMRESEGLVDTDRLRRLWAGLRQSPRPREDAMNHGDLIPGNVLVAGGRLAGVLDGGGYGPADPALDLVAGWHLLDAGPRETLRRALGSTDREWERGMAWALQQAMGLVWYYADSNPAMAATGRRTLERILAAAG